MIGWEVGGFPTKEEKGDDVGKERKRNDVAILGIPPGEEKKSAMDVVSRRGGGWGGGGWGKFVNLRWCVVIGRRKTKRWQGWGIVLITRG